MSQALRGSVSRQIARVNLSPLSVNTVDFSLHLVYHLAASLLAEILHEGSERREDQLLEQAHLRPRPWPRWSWSRSSWSTSWREPVS